MHTSMLQSPHVAHPHQLCRHRLLLVRPGRGNAGSRPRRLHLQALQSGWNPQQQQQQPQQPMQPMQPMQQGQVPQQARQPMPLARSPAPYQAAAGPVFLELTQVLNKQVITRTSGRCLGCISGAWLDPAGGTLVSFDLDERKAGGGGLGGLGGTPPRTANIPLSSLRQIGDVVLVHDESGLYEQDLDGRLGFVNPVGLDVRTRGNEFLGKVRDLSFSPDTGAIRRITYDEFGLPFLPISFFDCYSVSMQDVISIGRSELLVFDDAKYRERKESAGLFAAIPSLIKSLNSPGRSGPSQLALPAPGGTSDMYRLGAPGGSSSSSSSSRFLPSDYTYEQWQADLRRWEAETGMTYEQYLRAQGQQPAAAGPRNALPPGRSPAAGAAAGYSTMGQPGAAAPYAPQGYPPAQQQQRQPGPLQQQQQMYPQQPLQQQQQQPYRQQAAPAWQQPQQQPQQQSRQQQQFARRPVQQQYVGGYGQQGVGGVQGSPQGLAGAAASGRGQVGAGGVPPGAAPARQQQAGYGVGASPQQQQQQLQQQQQQLAFNEQVAQQRAGVQQPQVQRVPQPSPQQQQQQQQQPGFAGSGPPAARTAGTAAGTTTPLRTQQQQGNGASSSSQGAAQQQRWQAGQQPLQQQQQQQPQRGSDADGRPVSDWLAGETRPRIADALADGVLPSSADAPAPPSGFSKQQAPQQQQQQQPEVV